MALARAAAALYEAHDDVFYARPDPALPGQLLYEGSRLHALDAWRAARRQAEKAEAGGRGWRALREELSAKREWLATVPTFRGLPAAGTIMARLGGLLQPRTVAAGATIITKGDRAATEMYFIRRGEAEVLAVLGGTALAVLGEGKFCPRPPGAVTRP
jgi:hypothetical protein